MNKLLLFLVLLICTQQSGCAQNMFFAQNKPAKSTLYNGLVSVWEMDDASTNTTVVDCISGNTGTIIAPTTLLGNTGKLNSCMSVAGGVVAGGLNVGSANSLEPSTAFTISTWVNPSTVTATRAIVARWYESADNELQFMLRHASSVLQGYVWTGAAVQVGGGFTFSTKTFTANAWHHVVFIANGSTLSMYLDGELSTTSYSYTGGIMTDLSTDIYIGNRYSSGSPSYNAAFLGYIDQTAFWGRALTASEVASLYNSGNGKQLTNCVETTPLPTVVDIASSYNTGYCWFTTSHAVYNAAADKTWVGVVTSTGSGTTSSVIEIDNSTLATSVTNVGTQYRMDDHNEPAILILPDGKLLTASTYHGYSSDKTITFRRSTNAYSATTWDSPVEFTANDLTTYANLYQSTNGSIFCFFREGGNWSYVKSTDNGVSWGTVVRFIDRATSVQIYARFAQSKSNANIIQILNTTGHPQNEQGVDCYGMYFDCSTEKFYQLNGTEITATKPFATNSGTVIMTSTYPDNLWIEDVTTDSSGNPRYLLTFYPSGDTNTWMTKDVYYADWSGSAINAPYKLYTSSSTKLVGGTTQQAYPALSAFAYDQNTIFASIETAGICEIFKYVYDTDNEVWNSTQITYGSTVDQWRPVSVMKSGKGLSVFWLNKASYTTYSSYSQTLKSLISY